MTLALHLLSLPGGSSSRVPFPAAPVLLPSAPSVVVVSALGVPAFAAPRVGAAPSGALVEPVASAPTLLRVLVRFPPDSTPQVNGEPAPPLAVLSPGDFFQWSSAGALRVALFAEPLIGPPPPSALGRPCPVCRVPFVASSSCVACQCGVVLHCEPDGPDALQCAQMSRACPVCHRPIVLTEGYLNPTADDD